MYSEKIISILDKHAKIFVPYTTECEYQLDFRNKDKDKPLCVATIYHPSQVMNHNQIEKLKKDGYIFYKIDKLTIITCNSINKLNSINCNKHLPKPRIMTEISQLIDENFDKFKDWGGKINFVKSPCYCKKMILSLDRCVIYYMNQV